MYVLILYGLIGCFFLISAFFKTKAKRYVELAISGMVAIFFLIRFNLGPDYGTYYHIFLNTTNPIENALQFHAFRNIGFTSLAMLSRVLFKEYRWFVLLCNFISIYLCGKIIIKHSKHPLLSTLIFVGTGILEVYYASGVRQMLAMAIFFYAFYEFLPKKKYLLYEVFILIACLFHEISVVGLLIPLLIRFQPRIMNRTHEFFGFGIVISVLLCFAFIYLLPIVYRLAGEGSSPLMHIFHYLGQPSSFSWMGLLMECVFIGMVILLYYANDRMKVEPFLAFQVIVAVFTLFIYIAFSRYSIISRVCDFYQIIFLILLPNLIAEVQDQKKRILGIGFILVLNAYLLYSDLNYKIRLMNTSYGYTMNLNTYPYTTVFNKPVCDQYVRVLTGE